MHHSSRLLIVCPSVAEVSAVWTRARFGGATGNVGINRLENSIFFALGLRDDLLVEGAAVDGTEPWAQDVVFDDRW